MTKVDYQVIKSELKKILKSRKITYATLADHIQMSEANVKKMLNGSDLSFNKISEILFVCNVKVEDFFSSLGDAEPQSMKLNERQENFFIKNPNYYNFFYQLLGENLNWKSVKSSHRLNQASVDKYLLKLDRLGLIELYEKNKIKSKFHGNKKLAFSSNLAKIVVDAKHQALLDFAHIQNKSFWGRKHLVNGTLKMKKETAGEYIEAIKQLVNEFMMRSEREKITQDEKQLEEIGFLYVVTPVAGMKKEHIPNL